MKSRYFDAVMSSRIIPFIIAAMLPACSDTGNDPGPGGVTEDEAEMLDDAAEMLDEQMAPPVIPTVPTPAQQQEGPQDAPSTAE